MRLFDFPPHELDAALRVAESQCPSIGEFVAVADGNLDSYKRLARFQYLAGRASIVRDIQNAIATQHRDGEEVADGWGIRGDESDSLIES